MKLATPHFAADLSDCRLIDSLLDPELAPLFWRAHRICIYGPSAQFGIVPFAPWLIGALLTSGCPRLSELAFAKCEAKRL
ncbi:hypothetical protein AWB72_03360 [Caballeronia concitans]|uniref:Uncharacterized protein n=1 Tax=Caballeronia concitans TaxID=1777133 RepID=A0A658QZ76_9BURK|nr:hypothetical protein AWB72_03360 [Caballeronia concitans]